MKEFVQDEDRKALERLEEIIGRLLVQYQGLKKERDELIVALDQEREKAGFLEKKMDALSQDKERVKTRIDQLLNRLKGIDA